MSTESLPRRSFLGLEGQHVFITGAAGAIGGEAVREFLGVFNSLVACFLRISLLVRWMARSNDQDDVAVQWPRLLRFHPGIVVELPLRRRT
jgi:hypothetical protein